MIVKVIMDERGGVWAEYRPPLASFDNKDKKNKK